MSMLRQNEQGKSDKHVSSFPRLLHNRERQFIFNMKVNKKQDRKAWSPSFALIFFAIEDLKLGQNECI